MLEIERNPLDIYRYDDYRYGENNVKNYINFFPHDHYFQEMMVADSQHYRIWNYLYYPMQDKIIMELQANSVEDIENGNYEPNKYGSGEILDIIYSNDDLQFKFYVDAAPKKTMPKRLNFIKDAANVDYLKEYCRYLMDMAKADISKLETYHLWDLNKD